MSERQAEILLVENNPNDVEMTLRAFETNNLVNKVHVVRDGAEALEFLFGTDRYEARSVEDAPALVLLDLKLPLVDGKEVLRQLKAHPVLRLIPVVVLTSSREESDRIESYHLGVNSFIEKPVGFDDFVDVVRDIGAYWLMLNQPPALG